MKEELKNYQIWRDKKLDSNQKTFGRVKIKKIIYKKRKEGNKIHKIKVL